MQRRRRGILLDRDNTLIDVVRDAEVGVIFSAFHPRQVQLLPRVPEALRLLRDAGWVLGMATNQPGAARGQFPVAAIEATNQAVVELLAAEGVVIEAVETCLHHPEGGPGGIAALVGPCDCRKPLPGLLLRLAERMGLEPAASWMLGDAGSDVEAGRAAGMRTGLILHGGRCEHCHLRQRPDPAPDLLGKSLLELARGILALG